MISQLSFVGSDDLIRVAGDAGLLLKRSDDLEGAIAPCMDCLATPRKSTCASTWSTPKRSPVSTWGCRSRRSGGGIGSDVRLSSTTTTGPLPMPLRRHHLPTTLRHFPFLAGLETVRIDNDAVTGVMKSHYNARITFL